MVVIYGSVNDLIFNIHSLQHADWKFIPGSRDLFHKF